MASPIKQLLRSPNKGRPRGANRDQVHLKGTYILQIEAIQRVRIFQETDERPLELFYSSGDQGAN